MVKATSNEDEGTSGAAAYEANVKLSPDETRDVKGYKVLNRNANALAEIFRDNPKTDENFRIVDQDLQSHFMNLLADVYLEVKKSEEMLELNVIEIKEVLVQDMERNGLQLTWLTLMLAEVHKKLELRETIKKLKAAAEEAEQELSKLQKKPRLK